MTIRFPAIYACVLVASMLTACDRPPEQEGDAAKVVATIGGESITYGDVVRAYESQNAENGKMPIEFVYDELLDGLIDRRLMAAEARRQGADKDPKFRARLADAEENLLLDTWLFKKIDAGLTDERLQAAYQELIGDFSVEPEIHARHILLATEEDAKAAIARLDKGEAFTDLASELSTGPSASRGGDLGYFTKDRMIPVFSEAAFALAGGEYSRQPLQSEFGWHVILVEDLRDTEPTSFEDSHQQLRQAEAIKIYQELLDGLKARSEVERFARPGAEIIDEDALVMPSIDDLGDGLETISEDLAPSDEGEAASDPAEAPSDGPADGPADGMADSSGEEAETP